MKVALSQAPLMRFFHSKFYQELITAIFIILWLYVGITKLIDYRSFEIQMSISPIFHKSAKLVTFGVPLLEILVGFSLIAKKTRIIGYYLSFVLMIIFTIYVAYLMIFIPNLPCSCGGIISSLGWTQHLILNITLTILALIYIITFHRRQRTLRHTSIH